MTRNLIIRGFDDEVHSQLGELSRQKGVSINSIVKDAVDKWLKQQKEIPRKHHLIIYDDDKSIEHLLISTDNLAKEGEWFRCFISSSNFSLNVLLKNLQWFDSMLSPDKQVKKESMKYFINILQNILKNSNDKLICCIDFLINEIANSSINEAINLEKSYNENRLEGIVFCAYKANNLLGASITDLINIFDLHDQIFIIKNEQVHKLHLTKENVHKLFLS
ncbi:MAG TPA: hypothetical protein VN704_09825 [Verrucomicrobiae bacterium]|jgi:hypothetical protein|nr:hypothetical protein [Verrucomicrobiae bacterium]